MLAIKNARLILPDREVPDGLILCDGGKLLYAGEGTGIPEGADILDEVAEKVEEAAEKIEEAADEILHKDE